MRPPSFIQRFRKGVGGRGLATNPKKFSRNVSPLLLRGHRKKGTEKSLQSLARMKDFLAPTPSVRQPLFETSPLYPPPPNLRRVFSGGGSV